MGKLFNTDFFATYAADLVKAKSRLSCCLADFPDEAIVVIVEDRRGEQDAVKDALNCAIEHKVPCKCQRSIRGNQSEVQQDHPSTEYVLHKPSEIGIRVGSTAIDQPYDRQILDVMTDIEQGNTNQQIVDAQKDDALWQ